MRRLFRASVLIVVLAFALPVPRAHAQDRRCFPETDQCIEGRFAAYWVQNGGLAVFGFPVTVAADEPNRDTGNTYLTQWFQRNRFEMHPESTAPYDVQLGRLGDDRLRQLGRDWRNEPRDAGQQSNCLWFDQTGQNVCTDFRSYWESHGLEFDGSSGTSYAESLALFGLPLTTPKMETNQSGDTVLTQWFERARFELHPNNPPAFRVLLGLLGTEVRTNSATPGPPVSAEIKGFLYKPDPIQIKAGTTVTWVNRDPVIHTVTQGVSPHPGGVFDSGVINKDQSWSYTFTAPGSYPYFCLVHPDMIAMVDVTP
jgi:plastocyanin